MRKPSRELINLISIRVISTLILVALFVFSVPVTAFGKPDETDASGKQHTVYDFVSAYESGRSIGEMILDIEGAPDRAYDVLESAVFTAAYAISPKDDELTALRKVDAILFGNMKFKRSLPGTTFTDGLLNGVLDCSDASIIFVSAAARVGRDWKAVILPFHMFVAARDGAGYILWETQESRTFEIDELIQFFGLRQELIDAGVYLNGMSVTHHIAEAYRNIGGIEVRAGNIEDALWNLGISLVLWPNHPPTLIWRGYAYAMAGDFEKAWEDYSLALEIDPYDWVANYHMSVVYSEMGMPEEASYYMNLANRYKPENAKWVLEEALPYLAGRDE